MPGPEQARTGCSDIPCRRSGRNTRSTRGGTTVNTDPAGTAAGCPAADHQLLRSDYAHSPLCCKVIGSIGFKGPTPASEQGLHGPVSRRPVPPATP